MFDWIKNIVNRIKELNLSIDEYKNDTVIQSLPSYSCVTRAKKYISENRFEEAKEVLLKGLELPQKDALVYKYLGIVYDKLGDNKSAVENFQISAELAPQDKNIWQKLGFALLSAGEFERAEKSFENADKIQAANTDTYAGWGMALMKQKRYAEARERFAEAAKINRYNFTAVFLCAVMEIKLEMYDKAEMKLTFLANVCPNETNTFEFARLKALKNDYEGAIHYAKKAIEYNPSMLPAYILLGELYSDKLEFENSIKYFQEAEEKGLSNADLYLEWGKVLEKFDNHSEAKEKFQKAYDMNSENLETVAHLGLNCVKLNQFNDAEPLLNKVMESEPENLVVKQALGIVNFENGNIDKAIEYFRSNDEDSENCFYLAKCYEKLGNDSKVHDFYNAAIMHNPKYFKAYVEYSKYLISCKDYDDARRKLRKALKIDENNISLLNLFFYVSYILVKDNNCEYNVKETIKIAQKIEEINPDLFEYPEQKAELIRLLEENPERD